eukprot:TRINITY_DN1742_c0_g1_i1.p1 TRINITY_DN1742_c0_g1~~TRINITY_DN1742_c0_g1_i1.p1  ORF type:complete len:610 (+),score=148.68 TRINITY_DN1742_c0_g1_i1:35-1864(+)
MNEVQLIRDVIYGLLGYEGYYVKQVKNMMIVEDSSNPEHLKANQILKLGNDYLKVKFYVDVLKNEEDMILQNFLEEIDFFLKDYFNFIINLEKKHFDSSNNEILLTLDELDLNLTKSNQKEKFFCLLLIIRHIKEQELTDVSIINYIFQLQIDFVGRKQIETVLNDLLCKLNHTYLKRILPHKIYGNLTILPYFLNDRKKLIELSKFTEFLNQCEDFNMDEDEKDENGVDFEEMIDESKSCKGGVDIMKVRKYIDELLLKTNIKLNQQLLLKYDLEKKLCTIVDLYFLRESTIFANFFDQNFDLLFESYERMDSSRMFIAGDFEKLLFVLDENATIKFTPVHFVAELRKLTLDRSEMTDTSAYRRIIIDWVPKFPYSIIFSDSVLYKLHLIFRYLFRIKFVHFQLLKVYVCLKTKNIFWLRQLMMHFLNTFISYIWYNVISKEVIQLEKKLQFCRQISKKSKKSENSVKFQFVQEIFEIFADNIMEKIFLKNLQFFRTINSILGCCERFFAELNALLISVDLNANANSTQYSEFDQMEVEKNFSEFVSSPDFINVLRSITKDFFKRVGELKNLLNNPIQTSGDEKDEQFASEIWNFIDLATRMDLNDFY